MRSFTATIIVLALLLATPALAHDWRAYDRPHRTQTHTGYGYDRPTIHRFHGDRFRYDSYQRPRFDYRRRDGATTSSKRVWSPRPR